MSRKIWKISSLVFFIILQLFFTMGQIPNQTTNPTLTPTATRTSTPSLTATSTATAFTSTPTFTPTSTSTRIPSPTLTPVYRPLSWSEPLQLSANGTMSWFPDIVSDSTGQLQVVWSGGAPGFDIVYYTTSADGSVWTKPIDIKAMPIVGGSAATRPTLLFGSDGYLNLTFRNDQGVYLSRSKIPSVDGANSWSSATTVSGDQVPYFSRLVEDNEKVLHYFFTQNLPSGDCPICFHLFHRYSPDRGVTWSPIVDISLENLGAVKPQVVIDEKNEIHVVWEAGAGGGQGQLADPSTVRYVNSVDGGITWGDTKILSPAGQGSAKHIAIGIDKNKNLVVVWLGLPENMVYYQISKDSGESWSEPAGIPLIKGSYDYYPSKTDDYQLVPDQKGDLHLVLVGMLTKQTKEEEEIEVFHMIWDGTNWSEPDTVTKLKGDVPEWPRMAISNGNVLNIVWFRREKANIFRSDSGKYTIWYSRAVMKDLQAVPTVIPVYLPSNTPTTEGAIEQSTQQISATQTLAPAINLTPGKSVYTELDYMGLIGKAILPSLLVIGLVVVVMMVRRRQ